VRHRPLLPPRQDLVQIIGLCQWPMQVLGIGRVTAEAGVVAEMNPGSHAFAAAIDDTPASRSSLTIRSCNVPNARSMRSFACGLLAQMMSMFSAISAQPNVHAVAAGSLLAVHPEDAVLVTVERNRLAMLLQIGARRPEVINADSEVTNRCFRRRCFPSKPGSLRSDGNSAIRLPRRSPPPGSQMFSRGFRTYSPWCASC
jgi:hypothetical protein